MHDFDLADKNHNTIRYINVDRIAELVEELFLALRLKLHWQARKYQYKYELENKYVGIQTTYQKKFSFHKWKQTSTELEEYIRKILKSCHATKYEGAGDQNVSYSSQSR